MVVEGRIAWARRAISSGVPAQIGISSAADEGRAKLKIRILHGQSATSMVVREVLTQQLDLIERMVRQFIAVDRGHHHTGADVSEFAIWLAAPPNAQGWDSPPPQPPDNGYPPGGNDNDGNDDGKGPRPRRGRSPPSFVDPWQSCADPWSASSAMMQNRPPAKAPRRHHHDAWSSWNPTTTTATSRTPDPPCVRRRVPASTGTPRLKTAYSKDGIFVTTGMWAPPTNDMAPYAVSTAVPCDAVTAVVPVPPDAVSDAVALTTVVPDHDPYSGPEDSDNDTTTFSHADSDAVSDAVPDAVSAVVPRAVTDIVPDAVSYAVPDDAVTDLFLGYRRKLVSLKLICNNLSTMCNNAGDEHFAEYAEPLINIDKEIAELNGILHPEKHWLDDILEDDALSNGGLSYQK